MRSLTVSLLLAIFCFNLHAEDNAAVRGLLEKILLSTTDAQVALIEELSNHGDPYIAEVCDAWKRGDVFECTAPDNQVSAIHKTSSGYIKIKTGESLPAIDETSLKKMRPAREIRKALSKILDTLDLSSPIQSVRIDAALKLGLGQNPEYLDILNKKLETEKDAKVKKTLQESIAISLLKNGNNDEQLTSIKTLGELASLPSKDKLQDILNSLQDTESNKALRSAIQISLKKITDKQDLMELSGNLFRGLSTGSVLLIVSFGLAITFGLMGIINMAHGEFIAIGGYTCYVVQNMFVSAFGPEALKSSWFLFVSLPISFVVAVVFGLFLEKFFIRYLYKRPLESLLATWGISMILQQAFRLIFGAANVQVNTPDFLSGNIEYGYLFMTYTRLFVIILAIVICICTWLLLAKTNLGLYIRAVMQNRNMAANIGIPVSRVNAFTFAFGCGLASVAGVALSQIGNVGPSIGQAYIVDSFMVVVIGSVGNLLGAGISSMGIGVIDQFLQPTLGPVMGKITVFIAIILFLQWKPGGMFPSKSRTLDD